jgi:hypothetical protein
MREIQSITLDRARTTKVVDQQFADRRAEFEKQIMSIALKANTEVPDPKFPCAGMAMRCTGIPLMPISVGRITERPDLRIGVQPVLVATKYQNPPQEMSIRAYSNIDPPEFAPALRGWSHSFQPANGEVLNSMLVGGDGLIERVFVDLKQVAQRPGGGAVVALAYHLLPS